MNSVKRLGLFGMLMMFCVVIGGCLADKEPSVGALAPTNNTSQLALTQQTSGGESLRLVESLPAPENTRGGTDAVLLVGDLLEVDVFQVDELDKVVQIDSAGRISMPLIGSVVAEGKTVSTLERDLERQYGIKHLQSPDISVLVKESRGQQVTLNGEFLTPGVYPTSANTTLLQAVALARGLSPVADNGKIFVYRDFQNGKLVANYDLKKIQEGKSPDPRIYGGDIIVAFSSKSKIARQNLRESLGIAVNATRVVAPL